MDEDLDYKYVVAADPGGTTGVATMRYTDDTAPELVYLHQIQNGMHGYWDFFGGSMPQDNVVIVSESFTLREGIHGADVTPLRIEGVQFAIWGDEVVYQEPAMKSLVPDQWLKDQNLWTPGHRHQMDALIHAIVYLRSIGHEPTLEALSGNAEDTIAQPGEAEEKTMQEPQADDESATPEDIQKMMDAFEALFGGDEPERNDEEFQQISAEAQGQADGDGDGEPTGGADNDNNKPPEKDPETPEVIGTRKRRRLNGSFSGFDED